MEDQNPKEVDLGANPQVEDGHIDIANEIAEALARINFSAYEYRILWVIWRKTYGWHKKMDRISVTQFQAITGLKRWHVSRTLSELIKRNIVTRIGDNRIITYSFQKDYTKWKDVTKRGNDVGKSRVSGEPKRNIVTRIGDRSSPKGVNTKETNKRKYYVEGSEELRLASFLLDEIRKNDPTCMQPNLQTWAKDIDLMIRRDKRTAERIRQVIEWCQGNDFWFKNILSTSKLRKQFGRLEMEIKGRSGPAKTQPQVEYADLTGGGA